MVGPASRAGNYLRLRSVQGTFVSPGTCHCGSLCNQRSYCKKGLVRGGTHTRNKYQRAYSVFSSATPEEPDSGDPESVEIGMKFYSDSNGSVTGAKFYKGKASNGGGHIATLWTASGQKLASARFTGETSAGWQQVKFPSRVPCEYDVRNLLLRTLRTLFAY